MDGIVSETKNIYEEKDKQFEVFIVIFSIIIGVLFDILFNGKELGLSYPVFTLAAYIFVIISSWNKLAVKGNNKTKPSADIKDVMAWLPTLAVLLLSLTYFIYYNYLFRILNFMAVPFLFTAHILVLTRSNEYEWFRASYIIDMLKGIFAYPFAEIGKLFGILFKNRKIKKEGNRNRIIINIVIGLFIALPLLLIIVSLLESADMVFGEFLNRLPQFFEKLKFGKVSGHTIVIAVTALLFFSFAYSLRNKKIEAVSKINLNLNFADPAIIITILVCVNLVYLFFTFIQFTYLFGGMKFGLPENFTYAEYARRGFFELVAAVIINLGILLGSNGLLKNTGIASLNSVRILSSSLVAFTGVMLFSAHFRMYMYEDAYGYTYLRVLTHYFMAFLSVILILTLFKIWNKKMLVLKSYIITATVAFIILNYVNIEGFIAHSNIKRYEETGKIDEYYLQFMGYDAVPHIIKLLECGDEEIELTANNHLYRLKTRLEEKTTWQSFNISKYRAKRLLAKIELEERLE